MNGVCKTQLHTLCIFFFEFQLAHKIPLYIRAGQGHTKPTKTMSMFLSLVGPKGSGKNTTARILSSKYGFIDCTAIHDERQLEKIIVKNLKKRIVTANPAFYHTNIFKNYGGYIVKVSRPTAPISHSFIEPLPDIYLSNKYCINTLENNIKLLMNTILDD